MLFVCMQNTMEESHSHRSVKNTLFPRSNQNLALLFSGWTPWGMWGEKQHPTVVFWQQNSKDIYHVLAGPWWWCRLSPSHGHRAAWRAELSWRSVACLPGAPRPRNLSPAEGFCYSACRGTAEKGLTECQQCCTDGNRFSSEKNQAEYSGISYAFHPGCLLQEMVAHPSPISLGPNSHPVELTLSSNVSNFLNLLDLSLPP